MKTLINNIISLISHIPEYSLEDQVEIINQVREALHGHSPFKSEPVDFVKWVKNDQVRANDYNPNKVAPPEMELLKLSILADGYTQPIVTWLKKNEREVIDGFHRHRVGKESEEVSKRVLGYLPVVSIKNDRTDRNDRIASTIRHNRARGKHQISSMSEIVIELKKRNWTTNKICKHLGMDEDEVLRLCQISGLSEVFSDEDFSQSWDVGIFDDNDLDVLTEEDL